jgi:hypothetical protein
MHDSSLVCRLNKYLYRLKKAPRAWYANMDAYLLSQNFVYFKSDLNIYFFRKIDSLLLLVLYVDDLLINDFSTSMIVEVKRILHNRFLMMDMGLLHLFIGLDIIHDA